MSDPYEQAREVKASIARTKLGLQMLSDYAGDLLFRGQAFRQQVSSDDRDPTSDAEAIVYFRTGQPPELPEEYDETTRTLVVEYLNEPSTKTVASCKARLLVSPDTGNVADQLNLYKLLSNSRTVRFNLYGDKPFEVPGYSPEALDDRITDGIIELWTPES